MNDQQLLIQSKRLRALLWLAETRQEAIAAGGGQVSVGLSRSALRSAGIGDDLLRNLEADGWLRPTAAATAMPVREKGRKTQRGKRAPAAASHIALSDQGAALLQTWLASGDPLQLRSSILGAPLMSQPENDRGDSTCAAAAGTGPRAFSVVEIPVWREADGDLYYAGTLVLHVGKGDMERALVRAFAAQNWIWIIDDPLRRRPGDFAARRRTAIRRLNQRQKGKVRIVFYSIRAHGKVGWFPVPPAK
ncbi:MAG TPA: hypothetical protein VMV69_03165 [Pirellulales bacterium]|nr:hypothetical protein [Pirellulales bacterium]